MKKITKHKNLFALGPWMRDAAAARAFEVSCKYRQTFMLEDAFIEADSLAIQEGWLLT